MYFVNGQKNKLVHKDPKEIQKSTEKWLNSEFNCSHKHIPNKLKPVDKYKLM